MAKMRIQPLEVEAPEGNPFANDLFKREEAAKILTDVINSITGPCVLSVDAPWGAGKTTFLRMWMQYLRNEKFPVVKFNAWKTDFTKVPFIALSSELTDRLQKYYPGEVPSETIASLKKTGKKVLIQVFSDAIRYKTGGWINIDKILSFFGKPQLSEYSKNRDLITDFRSTLEESAEALRKKRDKPLVVIIDELDRCRPSYAVEFLETAKHLFAVDNIVFVLAVNREQLAHSVRALYGNEFDAEKYLLRFFDLPFRLPYPPLKDFVETMLRSVDVNRWFTKNPSELFCSRDRFQKFFAASQLSARDIAQALHQMRAMLALLPNDDKSFISEITAMLILKTINQDMYYRFITRNASDKEVVDAVFENPGSEALARLRQEVEGCWFEAAMIVAAEDIAENLSVEQYDRLLQLQKYYEKMRRDGSGAAPEQKKHAEEVLNQHETWWRGVARPPVGNKFWYSIELLEMLSPELLQKNDEPGRLLHPGGTGGWISNHRGNMV